MGRGWYAEKQAKVKKFDAAKACRDADSEVWWDVMEGRVMFPSTSFSPMHEKCGYAAFRADHCLSSRDKWAIKVCASVGVHVDVERAVYHPTREWRYPVYFADGRRVMFETADAALDRLCADNCAVKMWDAESKAYIYRKELL